MSAVDQAKLRERFDVWFADSGYLEECRFLCFQGWLAAAVEYGVEA